MGSRESIIRNEYVFVRISMGEVALATAATLVAKALNEQHLYLLSDENPIKSKNSVQTHTSRKNNSSLNSIR